MSFINVMSRIMRRSVSPSRSAWHGPSRGRRPRRLKLELLEDRLCLSNWESIGPMGETVFSVAIDASDPSTVYMGTDSTGVLKSTNGGATWSEVNQGLTFLGVGHNGLAIDPHDSLTIYAGTALGGGNPGGGVFKTVDGAEHWSNVSMGLTNLTVGPVALDPHDPLSLTVYAGTPGGLFKTINGGKSWSPVDIGLPNRDIRGIAFDPFDPHTIYVGTYRNPALIGGEVLKSVDSGANGSWSVMLTDQDIRTLVVDPNDGNVILAGIGDHSQGGLLKSTDGGVSWSEDGLSGLRVQGIAIDPNDSNTVYAATSGRGVFKTTDGGGHWSEINTGLTHQIGLCLAIDPTDSNTVYAGTGGTVFKTTDAGDHWSASGTGLPHLRAFRQAIDPHDPNTIYVTTQTGGVFKTTDRGATWSAMSTGFTVLYASPIAIDPNDSNTLYLGTFGGGIFKSTDGGDNWSQLIPEVGLFSIIVDPSDSNIIFGGGGGAGGAATNSGIIWSRDGGLSWEIILPFTQVGAVPSIVFDPSDPATIYAGVGAGRVFKSIDGGENWLEVNLETTSNVSSVVIDPTHPDTLYAATSGGGVFKSTDGGLNWSHTGLTNVNVNSVVLDPFDPNTIYASTTTGGVFKSIDGGETWSLANTGLPNANTRLVIDFNDVNPGDARIYALSIGHSVFAYDLAASSPAIVGGGRIKDASAQRSMVTSLMLTFSSVVPIEPGASELLRQEGGVVSPSVAAMDRLFASVGEEKPSRIASRSSHGGSAEAAGRLGDWFLGEIGLMI